MLILGIDPGIARTGYGLVECNKSQFKAKAYGVIKTPAGLGFSQRLLLLNQELKKIIKKYKPQKCAVEELFFYKNVKTAIQVGQARGVIMLTIAQTKIPVFEFTPLEVKQALTSYGRADKKQMQKMVKAVLNLQTLPKPDDAADALAVAMCCGQTKDIF